MTFEQLIEALGGRKATQERLKVSRQAVSQWALGGIPRARAFEIEVITGGRVKAEDVMKIEPKRGRAAA